jgi:electron transfer flavoprotein alpha subunit
VSVCELSSAGYNPLTYVSVLKEMVSASGAKIILANASMLARDAFPRLAARLDSGIASDCTGLKLEGSKVVATKPLYSGKCTAEVEFLGDSLSIVLMRSNQLPVSSPEDSLKAEIKNISAPAPSDSLQLEKVVQGESNKPDLTEANVKLKTLRFLKISQVHLGRLWVPLERLWMLAGFHTECRWGKPEKQFRQAFTLPAEFPEPFNTWRE